MGAFTTAVEIFGAQGVGVIPTRRETPAVPMVRHPDRFGVRASLRLAENPRFQEANAAIWAGRHSRLTIVDIDSSNTRHVVEAIKVFGDTPLKVSTPSGGMHLYYRHAGEQRRIRPFGKDLPLDVLGSGVAVVPPSTRLGSGKKQPGQYRVIEGDLASLDQLPTLRAGAIPFATRNKPMANQQQDVSAPIRHMREGDGRDNALFAIARNIAMSCTTEAELVDAVLAENAQLLEPLPVTVASTKANSAWRYRIEGRLFTTGSKVALGSQDELLQCAAYPPAFLLLGYLRCNHAASNAPFAIVPESVAPILSQSPMTTRKARDWLLRAGLIVLVQQGRSIGHRRCSPSLYKLA